MEGERRTAGRARRTELTSVSWHVQSAHARRARNGLLSDHAITGSASWEKRGGKLRLGEHWRKSGGGEYTAKISATIRVE
jgi:hypothetical protein